LLLLKRGGFREGKEGREGEEVPTHDLPDQLFDH